MLHRALAEFVRQEEEAQLVEQVPLEHVFIIKLYFSAFFRVSHKAIFCYFR